MAVPEVLPASHPDPASLAIDWVENRLTMTMQANNLPTLALPAMTLPWLGVYYRLAKNGAKIALHMGVPVSISVESFP